MSSKKETKIPDNNKNTNISRYPFVVSKFDYKDASTGEDNAGESSESDGQNYSGPMAYK